MKKKKNLFGALWKMSRILREFFCGHFPWKMKDENLRKNSPKFRHIFRRSLINISQELRSGRLRAQHFRSDRISNLNFFIHLASTTPSESPTLLQNVDNDASLWLCCFIVSSRMAPAGNAIINKLDTASLNHQINNWQQRQRELGDSSTASSVVHHHQL